MEIKIKKLNENAVIPKYVNFGDAGMDLVATSKKVTDGYIEYGTGLAFEVPVGFVILMFPRSSLPKKDLLLGNSVGVLDHGYRGELLVRFKVLGENHYEIGDKIVQIMLLPFPKMEMNVVDKLDETERGENGFGSTGK